MEWINKQERFTMMLKALLYTFISLGILGFSIISLFLVPTKSQQQAPPISKAGDEIANKYPAGMDAILLKDLHAQYIYDAFIMKKINPGDRLLRITVGRTSGYWMPLLKHLKKLNLDILLLWKESGRNHNYRSLYLGPIPEGTQDAAFIKKYSLNHEKLGLSRGLVETVRGLESHGQQPKVLMNFKVFWSIR